MLLFQRLTTVTFDPMNNHFQIFYHIRHPQSYSTNPQLPGAIGWPELYLQAGVSCHLGCSGRAGHALSCQGHLSGFTKRFLFAVSGLGHQVDSQVLSSNTLWPMMTFPLAVEAVLPNTSYKPLPDMVAHTFKHSTQGGRRRQISMSSRPPMAP